MTHHEAGEEYAGSATVRADERELAVEVTLRGAFQPIDGRFHWYGRVAGSGIGDVGAGTTVLLRTPHGEARGRLSDVDPWGRLRVTGTGTPPF